MHVCACVRACVCLLLSMGILFIIYLSSPECRDLPNSHLHWINKEMMGEEVFQLHVDMSTYATGPMSLYKARQDKLNWVFFVEIRSWCTTVRVFFPYWSATWSSLPVDVQQVFFPCWCAASLLPCWCATWSSFPAGTTWSSLPAGVQFCLLSLLMCNKSSFPAGVQQVSFPAGVQLGLLSLLVQLGLLSLRVCNFVFSPCWCATSLLSLLVCNFDFSSCWCATSLLSMLMYNRVFFPCWCTNWISLPAGVQQVLFPCWGKLWRKCNLTIFHYKPLGSFSCRSNQTKNCLS